MRNILIFSLALALAACAGTRPDVSTTGQDPAPGVIQGEHLVADKVSFNLRVKSTKDAKPMVHEKAVEFKGHIDSEIGSSMVAYIPANNLNDFIDALDKYVGKVKSIKKSGISSAQDIAEQKAGYSYIYIWLDDRSAVVRTIMTPLASIFDL